MTWVRHGWRHLSDVRQILKRSGLRLSTPRATDVEAILARHGLRLHRHAEVGVWQVALYANEAGPPVAELVEGDPLASGGAE